MRPMARLMRSRPATLAGQQPDRGRWRPAFFDFEFAGFRHALLDAAYLHLPFPTCWCVARLPDGLPDALETVYRQELAPAVPMRPTTTLFSCHEPRVAYWAVASVSWSLEARSRKQAMGHFNSAAASPFPAGNFAARADRFGHLPACRKRAACLPEKLRALWPATTRPCRCTALSPRARHVG
jgi:hypothetical protein